jgi:antitoxin ParD1/3/4
MNILLNSELEKFVQQQIDSGLYKSADEVVAQALMLMAEQERSLTEDQRSLRQDILDGVRSGSASDWDPEEFKREAKARKAAADQSSEA